MKIGIVGYGRMGRLIREICLERGHTVPLVVDPNLQQAPHRSALADDLARANLNSVECVIDFSLPEAVLGNIEKYAENKTPAVIGTTGWEDKRDAVQTLIDQSGSSLLYGSNFSVGANIFFAMTARLAELINHFPQYDMLMHEFHHRHKKDSPSGTALTAAEHILQNLERKNEIQRETLQRSIEPQELHVTATRGGDIPGLHMVLADSSEDTLELRHTARNRRGFALGAVLAAEWLHGKQGFFSFDEYFAEALR
ncbi:4-hydroxy-tetrahydrodipicolinate reductase [Spirochaeta africana]|uniref:4-hydroxy-tetrahydrodipicolinate reductase n=1 Tax=Spirochaeta africana (strain ATCC 700263 / DSM 8902 / Z-7692) TaxID=889378 RepID=H9UL47_SPIAZ|nr:4-hydroxy-tetrahydrodipicolinate reductase [Spirochaeta africana]AFG38240.1 dihydrodipicolinate reductase [Spirochaeta africana DSM 8902]